MSWVLSYRCLYSRVILVFFKYYYSIYSIVILINIYFYIYSLFLSFSAVVIL